MRFWDGDPEAIPVAELRRAVREEIKHSSVRQVAAATGIGRTTLHKLAAGGSKRPNARTRNLLHVWYRRRQAEQDTAPRADAMHELEDGRPAGIALDVLSGYFPEPEREHVRAVLLATMEHAFTSRGVSPPHG